MTQYFSASLIILFFFILFHFSLSNSYRGKVSSDECPKTKQDTDLTSQLWSEIRNGNSGFIQNSFEENPCIVHIRSSDGRGPLFWAFEFNQREIAQFLFDHGADLLARDDYGKTPSELTNIPLEQFGLLNRDSEDLKDEEEKIEALSNIQQQQQEEDHDVMEDL